MDATWLKRLSVASRDFPLSICPNIACPAMHSFLSWLPWSLTNSTPSNPITPSFLIAHRLSRRGITHLLIAQAHTPPTELVEVAGFTGTAGSIGPRFDLFDDGQGEIVPPPDASGSRNEPIRQAVLGRLNANAAYRALFGQLFPAVAAGGDIDFTMFARAIAEFEFTLVFANAPIDRFARGDSRALTTSEKKGALLFFGKAGC